MSGTVFVQVSHRRHGDVVPAEWVTPIEAITLLQDAIARLRELSTAPVDLSHGEAAPPLLAPSAAELAEFVKASTGAIQMKNLVEMGWLGGDGNGFVGVTESGIDRMRFGVGHNCPGGWVCGTKPVPWKHSFAVHASSGVQAWFKFDDGSVIVIDRDGLESHEWGRVAA